MPNTHSTDTAPRIAPLSPPYEASVGELLQKLMASDREPLKLFRTVARSPILLRTLADVGSFVYRKSSLSPLHRELIIQRTCARCGAEYEWGVHAAFFGEQAGITGARLHAIVHGNHRSACWESKEALLIEFVDQLHERAAITDDLWQRLSPHWNEAQILELSMLAGLYHAISFVINVAQVELEPYAPRFESAQNS